MNDRSAKILAVDDEEDGVLLLQLILEDYEVNVATNVDNAMMQLEQVPFNLIVSDLRMPGKDGIDLLNFARSRYPKTRFIMLTGQNDVEAEIEKRSKFKCDDIISKGCTDETLLEAVDRVLFLQRMSG